jgi:hypothetical protein
MAAPYSLTRAEEILSKVQRTNQHIRERQAEWGQYLMLHPDPTLPLSDELRVMIRKGIPDQHRWVNMGGRRVFGKIFISTKK